MVKYDYIIVGGGTAGCIIATELIENTNNTVLLIEAGQNNDFLDAQMPAAMPNMMAKHTWSYQTEPESGLGNRCIDIPQGRVLGGTSSVNGMAYVRGIAEDFENWKTEYGCTDWGYEEVLPYFKGSENNIALADEYHGTDGKQYVSEATHRHPLTYAFIRAGQEMGYKYSTDFNGAEPNGVGFFQTTTHKGQRASTAYAWLDHVRDNERLSIRTECETEKILIEHGRAIGVVFHGKDISRTIFAEKEVILTAGALGSPKLLMLSGVGPKEHLEELEIPVQYDAPNVGKNLQDHLHVNLRGLLKEPMSLAKEGAGIHKYKNSLQWLLFKTGFASSSILEGGGFFDLNNDGHRDTEVQVYPLIENFGRTEGEMVEQVEGFTLKLGRLDPKSRGHVELRSADYKDLPKVHGNYLSEPDDVAAMVEAVKFGLSIFDAPSIQKIVSQVMMPSTNASQSDAALADFVRESAVSVFHPVGTCAMGSSESSVLDQRLKVRGVEGLRVIDSSSFPSITSGNTSAPIIMLAYRGASMIIEDRESCS